MPNIFYQYVSNKLHPENKRIVLESNGNVVTNEQEICKLFAAEFATNFASSVSDMSFNGKDIRSEVQQNNTPCFNQINIEIVLYAKPCLTRRKQQRVRMEYRAYSITNWLTGWLCP